MKEDLKAQLRRVKERSARQAEFERKNAELRSEVERLRATNKQLAAEAERLTEAVSDDPETAEARDMAREFMAEARIVLAERSFGHIFTRAHARLHPRVAREGARSQASAA